MRQLIALRFANSSLKPVEEPLQMPRIALLEEPGITLKDLDQEKGRILIELLKVGTRTSASVMGGNMLLAFSLLSDSISGFHVKRR